MKRSIWAVALLALLLPLLAHATVYTVNLNRPTYIGTSADTKPLGTINPGAVFYESDTGKTYYWTGTTDGTGTSANWVEFIPRVNLGTLNSCEDTTLSSCWVSNAGDSANLTQATTSNQVKPTAGEVIGFYVNTTSSGTIRFFDEVNATCSTAVAAKGATITPAVGWHFFPTKFATGICALTGGVGIDVTVIYR